MAKLPEFMKVEEKFFYLFCSWAGDNIDGFHSQSVMVADRINYMRGNGEMIAYVSLAYGKHFYVKRDALSEIKEDAS